MMKQSCRKILQRLVFLITIVFTNLVNAQTLPVQVTPQLIPPHSVKISDYATITNEKLFVNILLTDVNEVGRRVRLKMYIEGQGLSIATLDNVAGAAPIFLDGGINLRLTNLDLQPYFQFNNLTGISPQQYNNPLPNGGYNYCFEVYDYFTGRRISQKSCTTVFLLQNDPPILNLPTRDNIVTATNPQNILFTWTPRHSNLNDVQYEFTLKELWDTQNPQANFLGSIPFYQTTTRSTTLLVGPEAPQLISGKVYGWQVRAFVSDGINETSVFKNNGGSEIFWFKYLEDCRPPSFVLSQALTAESVKIEWQLSDHIKYNIQYRKKGFGDDDWFDVNSYTNEGTIFNLEPDTVYEFRVGGECTPLSGYAYSNIQEFTTPSNDEAAYYNCGITPEINIDNQELLPSLKINETFTAGDFPVTPREVSGSNGTFSGWGYITLPFLENLKEIIDAANILTSGEVNIGKYTRIKVEFENVKINTNKQLIEGVVKTTYDPKWGGILDADEIINDILGDDGNISTYDATNMDIDDVIINDNGDIVIIRDTKNDGPNEEFLDDEIVVVSNLPVVITDQNGDQWTVDEEGNITKGEGAEGGQATSSNTNGVSGSGNVNEISSKDVSVKFIPSGFYGTDEYNTKITSSSYKSEYEFIDTHDDKEYFVLYKLISDKPESTDIIEAEVTFANGKTKNDIVFKTKQGGKVDTTWVGNKVTLKLKKQFDFGKDEIIATVKPKEEDGKYEVAGKLNTWHVKQREINLTLVSVNNTPLTGVKERINAIYNKAGVNFNISEKSVTIGLDKLSVGDSDMLSNYTDDEKSVIQSFKDQNGTEKEQYYMFFFNDIELNKDLDGFMPLKRQFGFVFKKQDAGKIAAHELGHGIFGLKHPWDQYNDEGSKTKTDYLMDYGGGTKFSHMDWQKLHAPGIQIYWFQGDEAGESVSTSLDKILAINEKKYNCESGECVEDDKSGKYYFGYLTPAGQRIILSQDYIPIFYHGISSDKYNLIVPGSLIGFKKKSKNAEGEDTWIQYWANIEGETFSGYKSFTYVDPKIKDDANESVVIGLPFGNSDEELLWKNYKFKKLGRSKFENSKSSPIVDITSDNFKQLSLFNEHKPFNEKTYRHTSKITGDGQIDVSPLEIRLLSGYYNEDISLFFKDLFDLKGRSTYQISHNERREVFLIIKIAEIYNRYPYMFEEYTKFFDNWDLASITDMSVFFGKWDVDNILYTYSDDFYTWQRNLKNTANSTDENLDKLYGFYQNFLVNLLSYINDQAAANIECLNSDFTSKTGKDIFECIRRASQNQLKSLSLENKKVAIKKILESPVDGDEIPDRMEIEIARIIESLSKSGSPDDFKTFLQYLTEEEITYTYQIQGSQYGQGSTISSTVPLWYALFDNIEDQVFIFGEDNRQSVVKSLGLIFLKAKGDNGFEQQLKESIKPETLLQVMKVGDLKELHSYFYTFENDYQNIFRRGWSDISANAGPVGLSLYDKEDFYKSVDTEVNSQSYLISVKQKIKWGLFNSTELKSEELKPFKLVSFINISKNNLLKPFTAIDEKGNPQAIFVPALTMHYASKTDQLQTQSDIIQTAVDLLAFLPSGGTASLNTFGKFLYYADKVSSVSSIAGTAFRETNPELAGYINQLSLVSGVASLGSLSTFIKGDILDKKNLGEVIHPNALNQANNPVENVNTFTEKIVSEEFDISKLTDKQARASRKILDNEYNRLKDVPALNVSNIQKALNKFDDIVPPGINIAHGSVVDANLVSKGKVKEFLNKLNDRNTSDDFIDIVIHGADNKFILDLPNGVLEVETLDLVNYILNSADFQGVTKFRLLSCSNMDLAEEFISLLPKDKGFTVRATDDIVRVHGDGGVSTVPRGADNPPNEWQDLTLDANGKVKRQPAQSPELTSAEYLTDFIELGRRTKSEQFLTTLERAYPDIWKRINELNLNNDELLRFADDFKNASKDELAIIGKNNGEIVDVWRKWGNPDNALVKLSKTRITDVDDLAAYARVYNKNYRRISFDDFFEKSIYQINDVIDIKKENYKKFAVELFEAWDTGYKNNKSIAEMQDVYRKFGLDPDKVYPPNEGTWGLIEAPRAPKKDELFDRFQTRSTLGGGYAGALADPNAVPTISARALRENYSEIVNNGEDYYYFLFKFEDVPSDLKFEYGEAMPWFGETGGATQIKSSKALHELGDNVNLVEKWKLVGGEWVQDFSILKNKFPDNARNLLTDASDEFFNKLNKLNEEGALERFIDDFKDNLDALGEFKKQEILLEFWLDFAELSFYSGKKIGHDIRLNTEFLKKYSLLSDSEKSKMVINFKRQKSFKDRKGEVDYYAERSVDIGDGKVINVRIHYDEFGYPKFEDYCPLVRDKMGNESLFSVTGSELNNGGHFPSGKIELDGTGNDMSSANKWAKSKWGDDIFRPGTGSNCEILIDGNWITHTWHHHQDGRTIFAVPSTIHNTSTTLNGVKYQGFPHSGGASLIHEEPIIRDFFPSPNFNK